MQNWEEEQKEPYTDHVWAKKTQPTEGKCALKCWSSSGRRDSRKTTPKPSYGRA